MSETELAGYITSVYGDLTAPIGPLSAALSGISDLLNGTHSYDDTMKMIRDIKAFKPEDIAKYADLADAAGGAVQFVQKMENNRCTDKAVHLYFSDGRFIINIVGGFFLFLR